MINAWKAERRKYKHSKTLWIVWIVSLIFPILLITKDYYFKMTGSWLLDAESWMWSSVAMVQILTFPALSGFVFTYLMQREYMDNTIQNVFLAPQKRWHFLIAKIMLWGLWYLILLFGFILVCSIGLILLYDSAQMLQTIGTFLENIFAIGILGWISTFPLMIAAILQRKVFYPSLFLCAVFTIFSDAALNMSESLIRIIPWSAVSYMGLSGVYEPGMLTLVAACGVLGVAGAYAVLRRQEY